MYECRKYNKIEQSDPLRKYKSISDGFTSNIYTSLRINLTDDAFERHDF